MEYHEIGERFEYDGVVLEVTKGDGQNDCKYCYMRQNRYCIPWVTKYCGIGTRADNQYVYYKLVEQCKTKDMEQEKTAFKVEDTNDYYVCVLDVRDDDGVLHYTRGGIYHGIMSSLIDDLGKFEDWNTCTNFDKTFIKITKGEMRAFVGRIMTRAGIEDGEHVNHPAHYNRHPSGIECIEIIRHYNLDIGCAIKYLWRNGLKSEEGMSDTDKQIEDLEKAIWYIKDEISRIKELKEEKQ